MCVYVCLRDAKVRCGVGMAEGKQGIDIGTTESGRPGERANGGVGGEGLVPRKTKIYLPHAIFSHSASVLGR